MNWSSDYLQSILGQIIGDPTHHLGCRWVEDNGVRCQNSVSKNSRIDGAICLKMFQDIPTGHSPRMRLSEAARYMLCAECRRYPSRSKKCAQRWMDRLHAQAGQIEEATQTQQDGYHQSVSPAHGWPTSMSYKVGTNSQRVPFDHRLSHATRKRQQSSISTLPTQSEWQRPVRRGLEGSFLT